MKVKSLWFIQILHKAIALKTSQIQEYLLSEVRIFFPKILWYKWSARNSPVFVGMRINFHEINNPSNKIPCTLDNQ